jgi:hypothetical protein
MATQVQWRGGSTAEHATFTGAAREITVDTQKQTLVVHDGSTAGGRPLLREDGSNAALSLGSAGTPSLKFTGDPNTGIYSPGADQVAVATNGTGRLFVDVGGATAFSIAPWQNSGFIDSATTNGLALGASSSTGSVRLCTGTSREERLRITSAGLVGIGTSSPASTLHVAGTFRNTGQAYLGIGEATTLAYIGDPFTTNTRSIIFNRATGVTDIVNIQGLNAGVGLTDIALQAGGGNVGIGTASPGGKLDVRDAGTTIPALGAVGTGLNVQRTDGAIGLIIGYENAVGGSYIQAQHTNGSATAYPLYLQPNGGNVGIGTASGFVAPLHVSNGGAAGLEFYPETYEIQAYNRSTSAYGLARYNAAGHQFAVSASEKARIDSSGRLLVGTSSAQYTPISIASRKSSGSNMLFLGSDSLANDETVRLYVQHGADVGNHTSEIGIVKHSGIADVCSYIQLGGVTSGIRYFWVDDSGDYRLSSTFAHIGTTSGTVVGTQTSDERIKNILGPVEYGLNTINQIEPVRYTLKTAPNTERLGFVAQQVRSLVPQSVFDTDEHIEGEPEDAPTKLGMEYVALIPVLVNAIKELSAEVDALKAQLA